MTPLIAVAATLLSVLPASAGSIAAPKSVISKAYGIELVRISLPSPAAPTAMVTLPHPAQTAGERIVTRLQKAFLYEPTRKLEKVKLDPVFDGSEGLEKDPGNK